MTSDSSFYPPRARWYSPLLSAVLFLRRRLALDHIRLPSGVSLGGALACIILPGVAFYVCRPRFWGKVAIGLSVGLSFVLIGWFGSPLANVAFGLLLSIHASGLAVFFDQVLPAPSFRGRLILAAALLVFLACCFYLPIRGFVQDHWFLPLRINERVIIVRREAPSIHLSRGDVVAYSFDGFREHGLVVRGGYGLGPILALPGDQVRFTKNTFEVNGIAQPRLAFMPESGDLVVNQNHWLVWPQFDILANGHAADGTLAESIVSLSTLSERQLLGRPCHRWLWRRQL
jgi:hypothetical protein